MDIKTLLKRFQDAETEKQRYMPVWRDISKYTGIKIDVDDTKSDGDDLDTYTLDPTTSLSVIQSADYLKGIIIGTGDKGIEIEPSDDVLKYAPVSAVKKWYKFATDVLLREINHESSGFHTAFQSYLYDQMAIGNSGLGVFKNELRNNSSANALIFKAFGVDTMSVCEGKNSVVDTVFNKYKWRTNQFVSEFCHRDGVFDKSMFEKLPSKVRDAYKNNEINKVFEVVQAIIPNEEYNPEKIGIAGAKYKGFWFLPDGKDGVFFEESFNERPISFGRPVKVRGEVYGRAYGTMLLSSIRCVNEIVNGLMITLDKMRDPALGAFGDAITGDAVIDTSAGSISVFDPSKLNGNTPLFKIQDVGDPSPIVNFLLPYLNEKLATAFKIDLLLDFSSSADMTATESLQRYSIRNKSILGLVIQQINDVYKPTIQRAVSLLWDMGRLGVIATPEEAEAMVGFQESVIPEAVLQCAMEGKSWFKIKFTNEIEKISNTDKLDNLVQLLQIMQGLVAYNPDLVGAVDWYRLLKEATDGLGFDSSLMSETEFKKQLQEKAIMQQQMMMMQAENMQSQTNRNNAGALKDVGNGIPQV